MPELGLSGREFKYVILKKGKVIDVVYAPSHDYAFVMSGGKVEVVLYSRATVEQKRQADRLERDA